MKKIFSAFVLFALFSTTAAVAGGMEGGGGKTVVCRNPDGSIRSTEILDLYEGRIQYQLQYKESSEDWTDQARDIMTAAGLSMMQSSPRSLINDWFVNALSHLTFLPSGTVLNPTNDSYEVIAPVGCAIEQTVNYQNDNLILVSNEIWQALSETQKAALIIHESVYRYLRGYGETDSRRARHFTAYIFSGGHVDQTFPQDPSIEICESAQGQPFTAFYVSLLPKDGNGNQKARIQLDSFGGRKLMSLSYVDVDATIDSSLGLIRLITEFKSPSIGFNEMGLTTQSLFEPGDEFNLMIFPESDGKWGFQLTGTSIFDGSNVGTADITCY